MLSIGALLPGKFSPLDSAGLGYFDWARILKPKQPASMLLNLMHCLDSLQVAYCGCLGSFALLENGLSCGNRLCGMDSRSAFACLPSPASCCYGSVNQT